jgi:hypothetical protein
MCISGLTNIECAADNFDDIMASELTRALEVRSTPRLLQFSQTLSKLENLIDLIDKTEKASTTIFNAASIAAKIPGTIGSLFKTLTVWNTANQGSPFNI